MNILNQIVAKLAKTFRFSPIIPMREGILFKQKNCPLIHKKFFFLFHQVNIDNLQFKKHHGEALIPYLKVQLCRLYNGKYMVASTQITSTEHFALIAVQVFKLSSHKVLFINRKDNRNC